MTSTRTAAPAPNGAARATSVRAPVTARRGVTATGAVGGVTPVTLGVLVAGPVLWLVAWTLMRIDGSRGPGWGWTTAHVAFLVASGAYAAGALVLARIATGGRPTPAARLAAASACIAALAGAVAFAGQAVIDLDVGARAATPDAMQAVYAPILATPGVQTWLFGVGPSLLFAGVFVLVLVAALRRRVPGAAPLLFGVGNLAQVAGRSLPARLVALEGIGIGLEALALGVVAAGAHDPRHTR